MSRLQLTSSLLVALFVTLLIGFSLVGRTATPSSDSAIAFLRLTRGYWQIWLMDEDGKNPRQLTTSPVDKHSPSWCPGNQIIHYYTDHGVAMLSDLRSGREHAQEPFLPPIPPPQGPDGELLELPSGLRNTLRDDGFAELAGITCGDPKNPIGETVRLNRLDLLPDGKALAVHRRQEARPDRLFELKLVDLANSADYGRFRSDGKTADVGRVLSSRGVLAFVSSTDRKSEVWIRGEGTGLEQLTYFDAKTGHPSWSPDGQWLAFDSDYQNTPQIFRVALARRGAIERLTDGSAPSRHPVFSSRQGTP